jgi:site-specific DNA-methyltransferase (cytosine-N4-specific)
VTRAPYYSGDGVTLYTGDAARVLSELPDASAHCVVTSPPYWGLRDYGTGSWVGGDPACAHSAGRGTDPAQTRRPGVGYPASAAHRGGNPRVCRRCGAFRSDAQHGLEATPRDYVDALRAVFAQLSRVLAADGTAWLNLGDCHSAGRPGRAAAVPEKNLLGMPWRVAFALQEDGWIIRNAVVWHKVNGMPEAVTDRLSRRYELLFLLVRQPHYHFDLDAIREPFAGPADDVRPAAAADGTAGVGKYADLAAFACRPPGAALRPTGRRHTAGHPHGRNPGDVWALPTRPLKAAHFAAFPVDLPLRCIAAGCPPGGVVLDPFSGASTTGLAARSLGRAFVGIDLNPAFHDIALDRLGLAHGHAGAERSAP